MKNSYYQILENDWLRKKKLIFGDFKFTFRQSVKQHSPRQISIFFDKNLNPLELSGQWDHSRTNKSEWIGFYMFKVNNKNTKTTPDKIQVAE